MSWFEDNWDDVMKMYPDENSEENQEYVEEVRNKLVNANFTKQQVIVLMEILFEDFT